MAANKSKRPRPKKARVRMALPVLSGSILRAGARVRIFSPFHDPRTTEVPRPEFYGLRIPFELSPTFFSDFLKIDDISAAERKQLGELLEVELSDSLCKDLDLHIQRFVAGIVLAQRLPSWMEFATRLKEIIAASDQLLESARRLDDLIFWKPNDDPPKAGALSLDSSVKHYLVLSGARPKIDIDLSTTRTLCADALKTIQPLASKRGQKANTNFFLFMQALFHLARDSGARITLPSRQIKEEFSSAQRTQFFNFAKAALDLALKKGRAAIENAGLPAPEKEEALKRLARSIKTDGGILEDLYRVRASARRNKPPSGNKTFDMPG